MLTIGIVSYLFMRAGDWITAMKMTKSDLANYQICYMFSTMVPNEFSVIVWTLGFPYICRKTAAGEVDAGRVWLDMGNVACILAMSWMAAVCAGGGNLLGALLGKAWHTDLRILFPLCILGFNIVLGSVVNGFFLKEGKLHIWGGMVIFMCLSVIASAVFPWINSASRIAWLLALIYVIGLAIVMIIHFWDSKPICIKIFMAILCHLGIGLGVVLMINLVLPANPRFPAMTLGVVSAPIIYILMVALVSPLMVKVGGVHLIPFGQRH